MIQRLILKKKYVHNLDPFLYIPSYCPDLATDRIINKPNIRLKIQFLPKQCFEISKKFSFNLNINTSLEYSFKQIIYNLASDFFKKEDN